jgi:hypothetical protein
MGYQDDGEGFMVGVQINPVSGLPSGYPVTFLSTSLLISRI